MVRRWSHALLHGVLRPVEFIACALTGHIPNTSGRRQPIRKTNYGNEADTNKAWTERRGRNTKRQCSAGCDHLRGQGAPKSFCSSHSVHSGGENSHLGEWRLIINFEFRALGCATRPFALHTAPCGLLLLGQVFFEVAQTLRQFLRIQLGRQGFRQLGVGVSL